ncbi:MAG: 16S rRNA (cytosine(1402)-N(4))-methyltransferase RsmH [Gammaproteobacteria bacterium]
MIDSGHTPVLLDEVLRALNIGRDGIFVDCTYGRGGHSDAILKRLDETGRLLVFDRDPAAWEFAKARHGGDPRLSSVQGSFTRLEGEVASRGWAGRIDGVLFDLGVSSPQLDTAGRGFSFRRDEELDMRFDPGHGIPAAQWLNEASESDIADVLRRFGEERFARRIAAAVVAERRVAPIRRTRQLCDLIAAAVPARERDKDPATRSFLAMRILINDELHELEMALPQAINVMRPGGRLVVISFHSLEDRIVKRLMRDRASGDAFPSQIPITSDQLNPSLRIVSRPVRPGTEELAANPRSRSAILRVAEKLAA